MRTMGQARRERGITEREYINTGSERDSLDKIATIRCLARLFGPPDHRYEQIEGCTLAWSVGRDVTVFVKHNGSITS
jgi:hypothetical protein